MACSGGSRQNRTIHTGDSDRIPVNFFDCAGQPVDITGATLTYSISKKSSSGVLVSRASPTEILIAEDGKSAAILLAPTHTAYSGEHFHKLKIVDSVGNVLTTFTGQVNFSRDDITSCEALTAHVDTDLFVSGGPAYMMDFSSASNAINFRLFMMR